MLLPWAHLAAVGIEKVEVHEPGLGGALKVRLQRGHPAFVAPRGHLLPALDLRKGVRRLLQAQKAAQPLIEPISDLPLKHACLVGQRRAGRGPLREAPAVVDRVEPGQVHVVGIGVVPHAQLHGGVAALFENHRQVAPRILTLERRRGEGDTCLEWQPPREQRHEGAVRAIRVREGVLEEQGLLTEALEERRGGALVAIRRERLCINAVDPDDEDVGTDSAAGRQTGGERREIVGALLRLTGGGHNDPRGQPHEGEAHDSRNNPPPRYRPEAPLVEPPPGHANQDGEQHGVHDPHEFAVGQRSKAKDGVCEVVEQHQQQQSRDGCARQDRDRAKPGIGHQREQAGCRLCREQAAGRRQRRLEQNL